MTGNELVNLDKMSNEEIMKAIGQDSGSEVGPSVPRLGINRNPEDDAGNRLPIGSYFLYDSTIGENVYGLPVTFRPFISAMQYMHFDPEKNEYVNRSIIFRNWKDEAIDLQGGTKCGKVTRKEMEDLTPEQQAIQRQIRCYRLLYGLVSFEGKRANGESHSLKNIPALWRVTGTGFRPVQDAVENAVQNVVENATNKRVAKGCDWIVANDVSNGTKVFGGIENKVHLIDGSGAEEWPQSSKTAVADRLAKKIVSQLRSNSRL